MHDLEAPRILEELDESRHGALARIGGRFLREGAHSANRRTYINIAESARDAQAAIDQGRVLEMRTHHMTDGNALNIAGKLTKVSEDGRYEGMIAPTEAGRTLLSLIRGGFMSSVSLRGGHPFKAQTLPAEQAPDKQPGWMEVSYFTLKGIDFTNDPGIKEASTAPLEDNSTTGFTESFALITEGTTVEENEIEAILDGAVEGTTEEVPTDGVAEDIDQAVEEALAKKNGESDKLREELAELRALVAKLVAPQETLTTSEVPPTGEHQDPPKETATPPAAGISEEQVKALVAQVKADMEKTFEATLQTKLESRRKTFVPLEEDEELKAEIDNVDIQGALDLELKRLGY